jgi:RNA polymerase sigma-70 factor, ECF subfamily
MPADDDAGRMLRFKAGDVAAFDELVTRHRDSVVTYFYAMARDRDLAEDLAQEVFVKIFRHRSDYAPRASFRTYLFALARNVWIDAYRSRRRTRGTVSLDSGDGDQELPMRDVLKSTAEGPAVAAENSEIGGRIAAAVARLPVEMREVFLLGAVKGMDYADVGRTLDIPVGTVKSRMFHAVRKLRALLSPETRAAEEKEPRP